MSKKVVVDKTLEFSFPDDWEYSIYENCQTRIKLQNKINSVRCVDLLLLNKPGNILYVIEVKDYDTATPEKMKDLVSELPRILSEKFIDTMAGLTCAKMCADTELKLFYRALINPEIKKRFVSFVELGKHRNDARGNGRKLISNLHQRMKSVLQPVCCDKRMACDIATLPASYGWSVTRLEQ
ncbi:MAG: hypothetical protein BA863_11985 [Desulfovibrio sp. S3730MH75]|nr:MAG: hypothetical protein BA863_11985 [Desulfovibrio sp. S3730MH75]